MTVVRWIGACALFVMAVSGAAASAAAQEKLVAPEKNPPGDIPDNQVFVTYTAPNGFSLKVPEGWSRTATDHGARFFDKYDEIDAELGILVVTHSTALGARADRIIDMQDGRIVHG